MLVTVRSRWSGSVRAEVETAAEHSVILDYRNLGSADLKGRDLSFASFAFCNLRDADCTGCDLSTANFYHADLTGADFGRARINWSSHDLIASLLYDAAFDYGGDWMTERLQLAGLVLMRRDLCWSDYRRLMPKHPLIHTWAFPVLARYIVAGDDHPALLDQYIGK